MSDPSFTGSTHGPAADDASLDRDFLRNTVGVSGVELFWGLGLPVVFESTFLQLLLRSFGASSTVIGLLPTMFSTGTAAFSLVSVYLTAKLVRRRGVVVAVHVVASLPLTALGLVLVARGEAPGILALFLVGYGAFCLGMGLLIPLWQDYVVRIFSDTRALPAMSVMLTVQSAGRLVGSYVILRVVERYAFSSGSSGVVFILVSVAFAAGSLLFLLTREPHAPAAGGAGADQTRAHLFSGSLVRALRNRPFLRLLGTDLEYFALGGVIAFYANFAAEHCGVSPAVASGLFVASSYVGIFAANVVFGWFDLLTVRAKYLVSKSLALAAIPLICFVSTAWAFLVASLLIGFSRGTRVLCYGPVVRRISGQSDAPTYFALAPLLTLPLAAGIPLLAGGVLDLLRDMGAGSYRLVFLALGCVMIAGLVFVARLDIPAGMHAHAPSTPRVGGAEQDQ